MLTKFSNLPGPLVLADPGGRTAENHGLKSRSLEWSRPPEPRPPSGILVQSLSAATGCEVDLARNNRITESGLDLGCRNKHRSLTHDALMIFCPLTRKSPCEVFGTHKCALMDHRFHRGFTAAEK